MSEEKYVSPFYYYMVTNDDGSISITNNRQNYIMKKYNDKEYLYNTYGTNGSFPWFWATYRTGVTVKVPAYRSFDDSRGDTSHLRFCFGGGVGEYWDYIKEKKYVKNVAVYLPKCGLWDNYWEYLSGYTGYYYEYSLLDAEGNHPTVSGDGANLSGGAKNDTISNYANAVTIDGKEGDDYLTNEGGANVNISGGDGNDKIESLSEKNGTMKLNNMIITNPIMPYSTAARVTTIL